MSHDDIVFTDSTGAKTFVENLSNLLRVDKAPITTELTARNNLLTALSADPNSPDEAALNDFFASFNPEVKPFQDWDQFFQEAGSDPTILQGFVDSYREILALGENPAWSELNITDEEIEEHLKNSFSHFLSSYPYMTESTDTDGDPDTPPEVTKRVGTGGIDGDAADNFFTNWVTYMAATAVLTTDQTGSSGADLSGYQQIYTALFGNDSEAFYARLRDFYEEALKETGSGDRAKGWFIPSQSFDEWFEAMKDEYITSQIVSSVGLEEPNRVIVIDRILRLLIILIEVLQRITAVQANRLSFLTAWQSAYTDLLTDIPKFVQGDGTAMGGRLSDGSDTQARKELRAEVNPEFDSLLQKLQARRSVVQDEAKQMQTTINTSQDAANQQTQMGTALLQQLSTLLSQIFR